MIESSKRSFLNKIFFGLSAAALMGSYSICASAALSRSSVFALICIIICALFSLKEENFIYAPAALLLVPLYVFGQDTSVFYPAIAIFGGGIMCLLLNIIFKNKDIPSCVIAGGAIGLALGATVLLTNTYFGIGAFGGTPLEMLKNYRYLGFHPDFRGLLYGTITLFTMITYPFKFRKLNKYIPAEFITVLVPFILNLILNPDEATSTTNEYIFASAKASLSADFSQVPQLSDIMRVCLAFGLIFYAYSRSRDIVFPSTNMATGLLGGISVGRYPVRGYTKISAITVITVSALIILLCPQLISRLPLPCVGSMLIVSAWQHLPTSHISRVIKEKSIVKIISMILCAVSFVVFSSYIAVLICAIIAMVVSKISPDNNSKEEDK